jgi:hypothetical protein
VRFRALESYGMGTVRDVVEQLNVVDEHGRDGVLFKITPVFNEGELTYRRLSQLHTISGAPVNAHSETEFEEVHTGKRWTLR